MDKLKMQSPDLVDENIEKIAELFPNCITEDRDENGTVRRAVDFDLLRQELSATLVEGPQERYTLSWPGKNKAILTANAPIAKTLCPCEEESVDFDNTKNIFIEGDNLDVLKLLQETYLNKVKMIYIDPPYNTGNDFIYDDDFAENADEFLKRSNQKDEEGNRLMANTESNGRFHSDWLSMMYPRLKLSRNLLRNDGVIFISIDDGEVHNLRKACDEVFGESNFIANVVWQKKYSPQNDAKYFSDSHEHILLYAKNKLSYTVGLLPRTDEANARYKNPDNDPRGPWKSSDLTRQEYRQNDDYEIVNPANGRVFRPPQGNSWGRPKANVEQMIKDNRIWFGPNGGSVPSIKRFLSEVKQGITPQTIWMRSEVGDTQEGKKLVKDIFKNATIFETPKPPRLIERQLLTAKFGDDDIALDFFAGSSTTAHAVMQLNAKDGGNRKFIMVQLPESCDEKSEAFKAGFKTIAEIGKERIRRAGRKIKEESPITTKDLDIGFRVFKVDTSNMKDVYYTPDELTQDNLELFKDHIKPDRRPEDLLFQVFLDWGLDLSLSIAKETIDGKTVFIVDTNALVACFDSGINEELVRKLAVYKPLRAVFRDDAFGSDSVKINVEQIFKLLSPGTDVKSI
ncbi:MAG: site-specific DNA-methyltransferase [Desulfobulbaceae bacterium]|nr:site-specific DNA-methyltransferase [Desulfobulbaceae bacterium]